MNELFVRFKLFTKWFHSFGIPNSTQLPIYFDTKKCQFPATEKKFNKLTENSFQNKISPHCKITKNHVMIMRREKYCNLELDLCIFSLQSVPIFFRKNNVSFHRTWRKYFQFSTRHEKKNNLYCPPAAHMFFYWFFSILRELFFLGWEN